jgi:hypothetical protein
MGYRHQWRGRGGQREIPVGGDAGRVMRDDDGYPMATRGFVDVMIRRRGRDDDVAGIMLRADRAQALVQKGRFALSGDDEGMLHIRNSGAAGGCRFAVSPRA